VGTAARVHACQVIRTRCFSVDPPEIEVSLAMPSTGNRLRRAVFVSNPQAWRRAVFADAAEVSASVRSHPKAEAQPQRSSPGSKKWQIEDGAIPGCDDARIQDRKTLIEDGEDASFFAVVIFVTVDGADPGGNHRALGRVQDIHVVAARFVRQPAGIDDNVQSVNRWSDKHW
jgi:hypothetical protein